jgi:hypothetical protein
LETGERYSLIDKSPILILARFLIKDAQNCSTVDIPTGQEDF